MTRLYLLDTNTVSYILKGASPAARARLIQLGPDEAACISTITEAELWYGLERIGANDRRRAALRAFLERIRVLPWDREAAATYGALRARQEALGRPLGPLDTQIAAHSIAVGAILVSNDAAFRHAEGLRGLESWATEF
ncbi:MAG: type II toxin-antitoxin system VapC family toxin [Acidobacteriaceae bacterium]|nr:type II toxin-antitoxin system VapC family toxin [Acidobacteriaceae bacterium]